MSVSYDYDGNIVLILVHIIRPDVHGCSRGEGDGREENRTAAELLVYEQQ